jgi:muramoyltetrapeptide carboxypeptidase
MDATRRLPVRLDPGDTVALVSPASWPEDDVPPAMVSQLESWGLRVREGAHIVDRLGYLAGADEDRLSDLNAAIRDPEVRAIIATQGGCGSFRLTRGVDLAALAEDPKPILGYSDLTALHHLWHTVRVPSLHGAMAGEHADHVRRLLMEGAATTATSDPAASSAALTTSGRAEGPLFGGNLEMLARAVGVVDFDVAGCILLLEINRAAGLGMVDRALTQLILSGSLEGITGVAIGGIDQFDGYVDRGWGVLDVLHHHLAGLAVPILGGLPLGHVDDLVTVPLGVPAVLDADTGELVVGSAVAG